MCISEGGETNIDISPDDFIDNLHSSLENMQEPAFTETACSDSAAAHPVQLPPRLVVTAIMHELARVAIAAKPSLLVVLADVRLVVEPHSHAHIG